MAAGRSECTDAQFGLPAERKDQKAERIPKWKIFGSSNKIRTSDRLVNIAIQIGKGSLRDSLKALGAGIQIIAFRKVSGDAFVAGELAIRFRPR